MAWTAPMTAVANTAFTAAQFNVHVRDNLLETAPAKAVTPGGYFVTAGVNSISQRVIQSSSVAASQTYTSTSYGDLATFGPSVSVVTGAAAVVHIAASIINNSGTGASLVSFEISGATSRAASESWRIARDGISGGNLVRYGITSHQVGLNPGTNIFTMKYRVGSGTGTFSEREIIVTPL